MLEISTHSDLLNSAGQPGAVIPQCSTFTLESLIYRENPFFCSGFLVPSAIFRRVQALGLRQEGLGGIYTLLFCHVSCSCPSQEVVEQAEPNAPSEYERQPKPNSVKSKAAETTGRHFSVCWAGHGRVLLALLWAQYCMHRMRESKSQSPLHVSDCGVTMRVFFLPLDSMWLLCCISSQPRFLHKFHDISALHDGQEVSHELLTPLASTKPR